MAKRDPELTHKIRNRIEKWRKFHHINILGYHEWVNFVMGDQWRENESKLFERYNKIPLTFNKLGVLMNHMIGDQMQNTPNLQIVPSENVDAETADIRAALIKNISLNSDAKTVYQIAFSQAIVGGFGAYRVGTEYEDDYSFYQDIKFYSFNDPTKCYWDISAKNLCKTDGMYAGFCESISRKMFASKYGKSLEKKIGSNAITDDSTLSFSDDDSITIIYDYERKSNRTTVYQLSDEKNSVIDSEQLGSLEKIEIDGNEMIMFEGQAVTIVNSRQVPRYKIIQRKIAGEYILSEEDFPSEQLPIVFVDQKSYYDKQGNLICRSFFQDVKDAQRFLNYLATQTAYLLKTNRYDQFMAPRKCVSAPDTEQLWRDPSTRLGVLPYDETPSGAKPEMLMPPELSQSLTQQYDRCLMDIQSGTGIYNSLVGDQGNEVSGEAINARVKRGSYNTYVPRNSLDIAITCGGQIANEMIPKVYDTKRLMMLSMPNSDNQAVSINSPMDDYGMEIKNDMTKGRYKIRLIAGQSYEGQKTEALESMNMILRAKPETFDLIGDLYVENLPLTNNIELRNRLRTIVPPEIIEAGKTGNPIPPKPPQPDPNQMMIQLKQKELDMKKEQAEQNYQLKQQDLAHKQAELQRKAIETHQDMSMEWEKLEAEKQEAAANLQESMLRYQAEIHRTNTDAQINHAQNLVQLLTHPGKQERVINQ